MVRAPAAVALLVVLASCAASHEVRDDVGRALGDGGSVDALVRDASVRDAFVSVDAELDDVGPPSGPPAPRPIAPLSSARVTSETPTLRWALSAGSDGAHVELCRDRGLTRGCMSFEASGTSGRPTAPLAPGPWFWRLASRSAGATGTARSAVWELFVGHENAPIDTSWGTTLDVNGDGFADLAVMQMDMGTLLYWGGSGGIADGATPGARLPDDAIAMVTSAGDVNGDGYPDLLQATGPSDGAGHAYVWLGGPAGVDPHGFPERLTPPFGVGTAASAGDLNGDGYGDVAVQSGQHVAIYLGSATGIATDAVQSSTLNAPTGSGTAYGVALAAGDLDGDGFGDLIVGAWHFDSSAVRVYVYPGSASGIATASPPSATLSLPTPGGYGFALTCAGDVNGDGRADLLVGDTPSAYLFVSGPDGIDDGAPASARLDVAGQSLFPPVAGPGDLDGDGYDDVVILGIGGPHVYRGGPAGITSGAVPGAIYTIPEQTDGPIAMAPAGDVDGDGFPDLVVGDPQWMAGRGRVYVYRGGSSAGLPATTLRQPDIGGVEYGHVVACSAIRFTTHG